MLHLHKMNPSNRNQIFVDTIDYKFPVNLRDVEAMRNFTESPNCFGCTEEIHTQFLQLMNESGKSEPSNTEEAVELLKWLLVHLP